MELPTTPAARPPSPFAGMLDLFAIMFGILFVSVVPLIFFELGRALSAHLTPAGHAVVIASTGLLVNLARPCRCAWIRR